MSLLHFTEKGIYCAQAGVYIDPWKKVQKALITHGHSDHAKSGSGKYLCTELSKPILQHRLGQHTNVSAVNYGQEVSINGVKFSFHPAAHVVGSAQIRVEYKGEIWVASGDYKTDNDGISGAFEVVQCHSFITESTFALPIYHWPDQQSVYREMNAWWRQNKEEEKTSIISAYSLGKAQRILHNIDHSIGPIYCHDSIHSMNNVIRNAGVDLADAGLLTANLTWDQLKGALVIAPGRANGAEWFEKIKAYSSAGASGWMAIRKSRSWQTLDRSFVLSDHADWTGLNETIKATGAEQIIVMHGYTDIFAKWLREQGYNAISESTLYHG